MNFQPLYWYMEEKHVIALGTEGKEKVPSRVKILLDTYLLFETDPDEPLSELPGKILFKKRTTLMRIPRESRLEYPWDNYMLNPGSEIKSFFIANKIQPYRPFGWKGQVNESHEYIVKEEEIYPLDGEVLSIPAQSFLVASDGSSIIATILLDGDKIVEKRVYMSGHIDGELEETYLEEYDSEEDVVQAFWEHVKDIDVHAFVTFDGVTFPEDLYPECDVIDLKRYAQLYFPSLPKFDLETIHRKLLTEPVTSAPDRLNKVISKVEILQKLWTKGRCLHHLRRLGNSLQVPIEELLRSPSKKIIDDLILLLDPNTAFLPRDEEPEPFHLMPAEPGIYLDVFEYDYSDLYLEQLLQSGDELSTKIAQRLKSAPAELIFEAWRSPLLAGDPELIRDTLAEFDPIEVRKFYFRTIGERKSKIFTLTGRHEVFVALGGSCTCRKEGEDIYRVGYSKVTCPSTPEIAKWTEYLISLRIMDRELPKEEHLDNEVFKIVQDLPVFRS